MTGNGNSDRTDSFQYSSPTSWHWQPAGTVNMVQSSCGPICRRTLIPGFIQTTINGGDFVDSY